MQTSRQNADESPWRDIAAAEYPALSGDLTTDVAVIGAGITGISTAHVLRRAGYRVAVLEARPCGALGDRALQREGSGVERRGGDAGLERQRRPPVPAHQTE
jgi:choline dehydrogenase-like flavoprotein